jgi:hypothetical protein
MAVLFLKIKIKTKGREAARPELGEVLGEF